MDVHAGEREVEMRVGGLESPDRKDELMRAIKAVDGTARVRLDPATGILHAVTRLEALVLTDALSRAGFEATAMTG